MPDSAETAGAAALERELLGGERRYTRIEVAERAGVPIEHARHLWRALGFADVGDDNVAFTDRDVEALQTVRLLVERGLIDAETELAMTRAMGQSLARLAEWQVTTLTDVLADEQRFGRQAALGAAQELVPVLEGLIGYVWRRQLAATAGRLLANPDEVVARSMVVGFADMVGFTSLTRNVDEDDLAVLVERFESVASDVVAELGGRVIKTVGDEVMFAADDAGTGADIAVTLLERVSAVDDLPELRIGVAFGSVLARLGDLYGEPVNLASRLTSMARPGAVLADRELASELDGDERFRLRRVPPRPARGYTLVHPFRLRRAEPDPA
ncbi:MAG TPA: adenylate/guanylate cyclase domain-containing protein [Mycobacteriales bacterium]|nr:adenylate/guanylate cyclase domain-containing protein [Mycobacteriales bacterium]